MLKECHVGLPSIPNSKYLVHKGRCESSFVNAEGLPYRDNPMIKKGDNLESLEDMQFFPCHCTIMHHRPLFVGHPDKNLRYDVVCKQGKSACGVYGLIELEAHAIEDYKSCETSYFSVFAGEANLPAMHNQLSTSGGAFLALLSEMARHRCHLSCSPFLPSLDI